MAEATPALPIEPPLPRIEPATPLWRSSTARALVAIALLVAATVGTAVWLSVLDERRQAQDRLTRQAHQVALQLRGRLVETEQLMLLEGSTYARSAPRFRRDMEELLAVNPALLRVELRARDGALLAAVDAPPPRPSLPGESRASLGFEGRSAFETASKLNRLTYSQPYFAKLGETGFDLLELVVPTGEIDGPMLVAIYAPQRLLDHPTPIEQPSDQLYSLVEADGTVVARQASLGQARSGLFAVAPLARSGNTLQLRVDGLERGASIVPNLMTGLVAATSVGLGIAMFFLVQDVRRRERIERALRDQVQFRRAVEEAMLHALIVYGPDDRVVHVNDAACRLSGWSREELVGLGSPMPFNTPGSLRDTAAFIERVERAVAAGGDGAAEAARGFETVYRSRSGEDLPMMVYETPVLDADGRKAGRMMLGVDLREQKRVEELARRQHEALQARSRLATLGEMASTLSHELNQPLAAVTSYATACENL
ncbi:MAG TPA: PAS domain S-box protein, partial [Burkholderiaceae bacterium]|nr:PAS domain S-box protein [Burkholderiaceae bacterium]